MLLLLIPLPHNIGINTIDHIDELAVASVNVRLSYFSADDKETVIDTLTDTSGVVRMGLGKETLFAKLFLPQPNGHLYLSKACYQDTMIQLQQISKWRKTAVRMSPVRIAELQFVAKDTASGHPIGDVKAAVKITYHGRSYMDTTFLTNYGGTLMLKDVPLCAEVKVQAEKPLYTKDTLGWVSIGDIADKLEDRVLYLNALVSSQTFFVKSTSNQQGLPGALVEAHIELNNQAIDTIRTIASQTGEISLPIPDTGNLYLKGTLLGYYDSTYLAKIEDLPLDADGKRTLWLRPKDNPVTLRVRDTLTGQPLSNADVTVIRDGHTVSNVKTNTSGEAFIGGFPPTGNVRVEIRHPNYIPKNLMADLNAVLTDSVCYMRPIAPPGPPPKDCSPQSDGRTQQTEPAVTQTYFLGKSKGVFTFKYNTYTAPDRIEIFCDGQSIWSFEGSTQSSLISKGYREAQVRFQAAYVQVVVTGTSAWDYTVFCPD